MSLACAAHDDTRSPLPRWGLRCAIVLVLALGLLGCERAPGPEICPRIEPGDLVFSELRATQAGSDSFGHYIEIYNASGRTIDLQGVWIHQTAVDGAEQGVLIREPLELGPRRYTVIGPGLDELPSWIDYGVGWDISGGDPATEEYPRELIKASYPTGFFTIHACDELIDEVFYGVGTLPTAGTLACGNLEAPPSAEQNDDAASGCWCVDAEPSDVPLPGIGLPGTPGRANRCP
ncbi:MAG: hypothetical protein R6X02_30900 [Enhygromyxa sp.]